MINAGDILYSSWGYDQTNIDYYQVTKRSGRRVYLQPLTGEIETDDILAMQGRCVPGEPKPKQVFYRSVRDGYQGDEYVAITNYELAYKWDGHARICSWYA